MIHLGVGRLDPGWFMVNPLVVVGGGLSYWFITGQVSRTWVYLHDMYTFDNDPLSLGC